MSLPIPSMPHFDTYAPPSLVGNRVQKRGGRDRGRRAVACFRGKKMLGKRRVLASKGGVDVENTPHQITFKDVLSSQMDPTSSWSRSNSIIGYLRIRFLTFKPQSTVVSSEDALGSNKFEVILTLSLTESIAELSLAPFEKVPSPTFALKAPCTPIHLEQGEEKRLVRLIHYMCTDEDRPIALSYANQVAHGARRMAHCAPHMTGVMHLWASTLN